MISHYISKPSISLNDLAKDKDNVTANRDASRLLLLYLTTGQRHSEIVDLEFSDIQIRQTHFIITSKTKGNIYRTQRIDHSATRKQLICYLKLSQR